MEVVSQPNLMENGVGEMDLGVLREKYLEGEFLRFYEQEWPHPYPRFVTLSSFLGKEERKGLSLDFLKESAILILSESYSSGVDFGHFESQMKEWLVYCEGFLVNRQVDIDKDLKDIFHLMLCRDEEMETLADKRKLKYSGDIIKELCLLSTVDDLKGLLETGLLNKVGGVNVFNRQCFFENISAIRDDRFAVGVLSDLFTLMEVDETIDLVDLLDSGEVWNGIKNKLCGVSEEVVVSFWSSFRGYCDRRIRAGYSTSLQETMAEQVLEGLIEDMPVDKETMVWLQKTYAQETSTVNSDTGQIWRELADGTGLDRIYAQLSKCSYNERLAYLDKYLSKESLLTRMFIAQIFSSGFPGDNDNVDDWETWQHTVGFDWNTMMDSEPLKKIWERIKYNPVESAYQLGYWLSNFPVKSLEDIGMERLDLVEGVSLDAGTSNLCGFAEIYMQESLNLDKVQVIYEGKLIYKEIGNEAALCTKDFEVIDDKGKRRVFKRGCFYMPFLGADSNRWRYARPVGGSVAPKGSKDLLHLADRWLTKKGMAKQERVV